MAIVRDAYELAELADVWGASDADIRSLVGQGLLKLCIRIVGQPVVHQERVLPEDGAAFWSPVEEGVFNGLADLAQQDAFRLLRDGDAIINDFFVSSDRLVSLQRGDGFSLRSGDLLVRKEHAAQVQVDVIGVPHNDQDAFDFRFFIYDGVEFPFTLPQARALEFLLLKAKDGAADQHYTEILKSVGSSSQRLSSLFSRKPHWTRLVKKTPGHRGWYYLDPDFVVWRLTSS